MAHPAFSQVQRAAEFLRQRLPVTRLVPAASLSSREHQVYLKLESELPTGSFKPRGALYSLSENLARHPIHEVIASSTGNHGAAVAYAAKLLAVSATIFLPKNPNPVKRQRIAQLGARIVERGDDSSQAYERAAAECADKPGAFLLNDATDPDVAAGTATIACEILDQLPEADAMYVPMGDTALIRGIAAAAKQRSPRVKIVGVQAERAPAYYLSWKQAKVVITERCDTIADGLATRTPHPDNVGEVRELVDQVLLVSEEQMLHAIRHLLLEEHIVAEPAGAAATAAWLSAEKHGHNIVLLVSGANVAPEILRRAVCGTSESFEVG